MRPLFLILTVFSIGTLCSQEIPNRFVPDEKYLEDQFYLGITYNILLDKPPGVSQRSLSYGLIGGFIKDLPLNAERNIGLGIGIGYGLNSYYTNLRATETEDGIEYEIIGPQTSYKRSKIETHVLEVPLEFRWRNSDSISHKFWRVYTGVKLGYVFYARSKYVSDIENISFQNDDVREFQYGLTLSFGYNTFNFHAYYSLQELFNDGVSTVDGDSLSFVPFHIGIIFYIL